MINKRNRLDNTQLRSIFGGEEDKYCPEGASEDTKLNKHNRDLRMCVKPETKNLIAPEPSPSYRGLEE